MKKTVLTSFTILCLLSTVLLMGTRISVKGSTKLSVHNIDTGLDYATIQSAIDSYHTLDGHTILVDAGTYIENVVVDKALTLLGENPNTTFIEWNEVSEQVVLVNSDSVHISGFTIRNALSPITHNYDGLALDNCSNCSVSGNKITSNDDGISVWTSSNCFISENEITNNNYGIRSYGTNNTIIGNTVTNNGWLGVEVCGQGDNISRNIITSNALGMWLEGSHGNVLRNNKIAGNLANFGVGGYSEGPSDFVHDIDGSNIVDGKPIYYWINQEGREVPADAGYVALINSTNISVKNSNISNGCNGILLAFSSDCTIENVNVLYHGAGSDPSGGGIQVIHGKNITICNSKIMHTYWQNVGVKLISCKDCSISRNTVKECYDGIRIIRSKGVNITNNIMNNVARNIRVWSSGNIIMTANRLDNSSGAIDLSDSSHNIIESNSIMNNYNGIHFKNGSENVIIGNQIMSNRKDGIGWLYGGDNAIIGNTIKNNSMGVEILDSDNTFYHNNFINNTEQAYSGDDSYWDKNYWSDYIAKGGYDDDQDGIGDTPYIIGVNNQDNHPLMGMFSDFNATSEHHVQIICNSSTTDFQFNGTAISFNVTGENDTTGFCRICIPTALMNDTYRVFVNGTDVHYTLLLCSNGTHSYLYFTYNHSTQEVVIIPEFPVFLVLPIFMISTPLAVIVYRRKYFR